MSVLRHGTLACLSITQYKGIDISIVVDIIERIVSQKANSFKHFDILAIFVNLYVLCISNEAKRYVRNLK